MPLWSALFLLLISVTTMECIIRVNEVFELHVLQSETHLPTHVLSSFTVQIFRKMRLLHTSFDDVAMTF